MKRATLIICVVLVLVGAVFLRFHPVGSIQGPELERVCLEDGIYEEDTGLPFSAADRGRFLGIASNGRDRFLVFRVKGDREGNYLYRLWGHDGAFLKKILDR